MVNSVISVSFAYHVVLSLGLMIFLQHVLERGEPDGRRKITEKLTGNVVQMSQHKYAYATHPTLWRSAWNMLIAPRELLTEDHIHINF